MRNQKAHDDYIHYQIRLRIIRSSIAEIRKIVPTMLLSDIAASRYHNSMEFSPGYATLFKNADAKMWTFLGSISTNLRELQWERIERKARPKPLTVLDRVEKALMAAAEAYLVALPMIKIGKDYRKPSGICATFAKADGGFLRSSRYGHSLVSIYVSPHWTYSVQKKGIAICKHGAKDRVMVTHAKPKSSAFLEAIGVRCFDAKAVRIGKEKTIYEGYAFCATGTAATPVFNRDFLRGADEIKASIAEAVVSTLNCSMEQNQPEAS